ncbi:hypothetical protein [Streptomyces sp. MZ04]|uniref:hypothetical protein n=1 Tax=Streptomyces sp. MZ04 TaxID=2559236 RepID=UPI00107E781C|nr:hypothetical protein [Streptomyces sp. MZ04]TGB09444.1 hypothetical protein E2651_16235 [Streptomyces sp. MZ04]
MSERDEHDERDERDEQAGSRARRLPEELRELGRSLDRAGAGGSSMAERVIAQIIAESVPVPVAEPPGRLDRLRRWLRARWRILTAALCGLLTAAVLTPPVPAAVFEWFDFGGVEVRYDPSAAPPTGAGVPGCGGAMTLTEAERRAGFAPVVPAVLGAPDAVAVTLEPGARVLVSLCWRDDGRTIRLDEFSARLDPGFAKTVRVPPDWVQVGRGTGLWFPRPHRLTFWMVEGDGERWERSERTAGPTLLWTHGADTTLRLEGVASKERALEIGKSVGTSVRIGPDGSGT